MVMGLERTKRGAVQRLELETGLVREAKTKTHNIHARRQTIRGRKWQTKREKYRKKKTYVGIAWVNVKEFA